MENGSGKMIRKKDRFNLIWASILFGGIYWILESIREMVLSEDGTLLDHVFGVGVVGFWMRALVVLILILFGVFAQKHRVRLKNPAERDKYLESRRPGIIWVGFGFAAFYWILESVRDLLLFGGESLFQQIFVPVPLIFWMRIMAVCVLMLFSVYAQNLVDAGKKMEIALREANRRLKEMDRLKNDFLSIVSHELRTPIAIMREGVSLCLDENVGPLNTLQRKLLTDTQNNIDRLNRLVTDLLDLSRIEEGKLRLRRRLVDFCEIARGVCKSFLTQTREMKIELNLRLPGAPLRLYADDDKIAQILNNLLMNALRFTNKGGKILVHVEEAEDGVKCSVIDTGIGIAEENIPKLFSKFQQVGRVDGPGYKGTGLGLAICKGLVEKHGGKIWAESRIGQGSAFRFIIPSSPAPKVLIVDDEQPVVELVREFLEEDGYRFTEANNGMDAIDKAVSEKPAVIIMDMRLPGMNGYEIVGRLKHDIRTKDIPIIIMSAFDVDRARLGESAETTAFPIISKPFEREAIRNSVREALVE